MSDPEVRVIMGAREWRLGASTRTLPAGQIVIGVSGSRSRAVMLDGQLVRLSSGKEGLLAVDLKRSTGYHRLEVDGSTFWFATEDAKLGLEGIEAMLADLKTMGTGWTGQALFSDGTGLRDTHVLYAWLDQWADVTLAAMKAILATPRASSTKTRVLSRRGGSGVLVAPTLRLLRSAPRRYLSASPSGLISVDGESFDPLRVVRRRRSMTLDTIANRRAVTLLGWLVKVLEEVLSSDPEQGTMVRCRLWLSDAEVLQRRPLAQRLARAEVGAVPRQAEEATEARFRVRPRRQLRRDTGRATSYPLTCAASSGGRPAARHFPGTATSRGPTASTRPTRRRVWPGHSG